MADNEIEVLFPNPDPKGTTLKCKPYGPWMDRRAHQLIRKDRLAGYYDAVEARLSSKPYRCPHCKSEFPISQLRVDSLLNVQTAAEISTRPVAQSDVSTFLSSVFGMLFLITESVKAYNAHLSGEEIANLAGNDPRGLQAIVEAIMKQSMPEGLNEDGDGDSGGGGAQTEDSNPTNRTSGFPAQL